MALAAAAARLLNMIRTATKQNPGAAAAGGPSHEKEKEKVWKV